MRFDPHAAFVEFSLHYQVLPGGAYRWWAEDSGALLETDEAPADGYGWPTILEAFYDAIRWALEHELVQVRTVSGRTVAVALGVDS